MIYLVTLIFWVVIIKRSDYYSLPKSGITDGGYDSESVWHESMRVCIACHVCFPWKCSSALSHIFSSLIYMNSLLLANYVVKCQVGGALQVNNG